MRAKLETGTISNLSPREAMHLQALEGNPLDAQQVEMFEMFEREAWTDERRRDHIRNGILAEIGVLAAE